MEPRPEPRARAAGPSRGPEPRAIGFLRQTTWTDDQLRAARDYEHEAARYSLQLLHEAGIRDLDPWISDFAACDCAYLMHFYTTGEKRPFRSFWRDGPPCWSRWRSPRFSRPSG